MLEQARDKVRKHIRTHSERSAEDRAAISLLGTFLNPGGRINTAFAANDTWPNHDGTFEFVLNPEASRRPTKNFLVQIKGTSVYTEKEGIVRYSLKSLAFPAYIYDSVTFDPGILFVVIDPEQRGAQRVFWKYMSVSFLNSIDFQEIEFSNVIDSIYKDARAPVYKEVLLALRARYSRTSDAYGRNVVRYLLLNLREKTLESVMPTKFTRRLLCDELFLSSSCVPFERNPFISDLAGSRTSVSSQIKNLMRVAGPDKIDVVLPYLRMKNAIQQTGEI